MHHIFQDSFLGCGHQFEKFIMSVLNSTNKYVKKIDTVVGDVEQALLRQTLSKLLLIME